MSAIVGPKSGKVIFFDPDEYLTGNEARKERADLLNRLRQDEFDLSYYQDFRKEYVSKYRWKNASKEKEIKIGVPLKTPPPGTRYTRSIRRTK